MKGSPVRIRAPALGIRDTPSRASGNVPVGESNQSYTNDMDMYLPSDIARLLGTSLPRVQRAIRRLGLHGNRGQGVRERFTAAQLGQLRDELGVTPSIAGFSVVEVRVLAALARAPLGVSSTRVLAGRAGVSPTAAARAVEHLLGRELVLREQRMVAAGAARRMSILRANVRAPEWQQLAPALARVVAPRRPSKQVSRVPRHLRHLFWNTAPSQMDTARAGGYIARRLLTTGDPEGLAWGATQLRAEDWENAAGARGLDPQQRAMAHNIAASRVP